MARKVYLHIGTPKTGTTYIQRILWQNKPALKDAGLLLPGTGNRQHLFAALDIGEVPGLESRHAKAPGTWKRFVEQIADWDGDALVTHEFMSSASAEQAASAIADLAPAEVHIVVTARECLSVMTAHWQEQVKNRGLLPIDRFPAPSKGNPGENWGWRALDTADVLDRWTATVPPERVHVITLPDRAEGRDALWHRFAGVLGIRSSDEPALNTSVPPTNESLGLVQTQLLLRINQQLTDFATPFDRGHWVRGYLGHGMLAGGDERFWPTPEQIADCRERSIRIVENLRARDYDVIGDLDSLLTPAELPERRTPLDVTDSELAEAAAELIVAMLSDLRARTKELRDLAYTENELAAQIDQERERIEADNAAHEKLVYEHDHPIRTWLGRRRHG